MWQWQPHVCVRAMARHPQLFVFVSLTLVTFITRYGNSTFSSKPIILPPMPPRKFFPFSSPVLEFPFGRVAPLLELTIQDEITFVMYYAPWCTRSMAVRWEFHKAAKFMQNRVKFVAINCWWNEGECRRKYKFMSYPVLYVYHTILDGYQYSGVHTAEHFVKFLEDIIYPLTYLHDENEVKKFISLNDNAVIGYFDFNSSPQPPGYLQFYYASMRSVEKDPLQVLKFGIVTSPLLANSLTMGPNVGEVVMVKHKNILKNPSARNFTSSELVKWAFEVRQQPLVKILSPSGMKSLQLSTEIAKGATVIMFYIHNPLFDANQYYHLLREVALDYIRCTKDNSFNEMISSSFNHRLSSMKKIKKTVEICRKSHLLYQLQQKQNHVYLHPSDYPQPSSSSSETLSMNSMSPPSPMCRCCVSVLHKQLLQGHVYHNVCEVCHSHNLTDGACHTFQSCPGSLSYELRVTMYSTLSNKCLEISPNYMPHQHKSVCCRHVQKTWLTPLLPLSPSPTSSSYTSSTSETVRPSESKQARLAKRLMNRWPTKDPFIEGVLKDGTQRLCDRLNFQLVQGVPLDTDLSFETLQPIQVANFTGLSCRTNRTVLFYAMDVINHSVFAERLGINATELAHTKKPALIIIDKKDEKSYFFKKPFTKSFVAEFIVNYTTGDIEREMLSSPSSNSVSHQNHNSSDNDKRPNRESGVPPDTDFASSSTTPNIVRVTEITSHTFQQLVINTSNDVLLLYYAPWCGFCASFAHIYLSLARYFQQASNLLFARINGESEDLPWEYTADTYPTLLFFPSGRKQDSVVFSEELPKSLPNLIRFVLHHATHSVRLRTDTAQRCTSRCINTNLQNAFNRISILDKQLKRLEHRLARLEGTIFRSNLLNASHKADPPTTPVQAASILALRTHWGQQVHKKQHQKQICQKLVHFLQTTRQSLDKDDLVRFMKANNILLESAPSR